MGGTTQKESLGTDDARGPIGVPYYAHILLDPSCLFSSRLVMKIVAVCAQTPGFNTGMLSVDLALKFVIPAIFPFARERVQIEMFNLEEARYCRSSSEQFSLTCHRFEVASPFSGYDRIFYWGDFLRCRRYPRRDLRARTQRKSPPEAHAEIESRIYDCMFLENQSDTLKARAIAFGGLIYINTLADERDPRYSAAIAGLYRNARLVMMRDLISAFYAKRWSGFRDGGFLGLDAAFLLPRGLTLPGTPVRAEPIEGRPRIGFSFGRGLSEGSETLCLMRHFVDSVAARIDADVVDINWLGARANVPIDGLFDKLALIRSCDFIISDTYHCCINSWREEVPAFCIGQAAEVASGALSEKKKELLYLMFNMLDHFVATEVLSDDRREAAVATVADLGCNPERRRAVVANLDLHVDAAFRALARAFLD